MASLSLFNQQKTPPAIYQSSPLQEKRQRSCRRKNWSQIRQYLGYQRFDKKHLVEQLNDLYTNQWNSFFNFFIPSVKLVQKYRQGSKIIKKYDKPKTPFQRIAESPYIPEETKQQLQQQLEKLNPFELYQHMVRKIRAIIKQVSE